MKETGFVNLYVNIETKQVFCSNTPYSTKEEASEGLFCAQNVEKVGCFEIKYTKNTKSNGNN